jgi:cytidylate kinase
MVVDGAGGADPLTEGIGPRGAASAVAARAAGAVAAVGGVDRPPAGLPRTIAIDGPAGAGKSTVALELARRLGYFYFDTGALYRAVTLATLRRGLPLDDEARLARLIDEVDIDVLPPGVDDGRTQTVTLDGEDVTWAIRAPEVDRNVSSVSAHGPVRRALLERQRQVAARGGVIMAGRDIGTVVLPDADLKLYLEASPPERAQRRAVEERARGLERPFPEVLAEIERRDDIDAHRAVSPLRRADDAILLDTEHLDFAGVLEQIEQILARRAERAPGERA